MAYLIDGNNLMGQADPYFKYNISSRSQLIGRLLLFQKATRSRLFLVFDGRPPEEDRLIKLNPKFTVLFPESGQSADELIEELLNLKKDRRYYQVVSSDRGVREIARQHGVKSMTCQEFLKELKKILKDSRANRELEKQTEDSTPLEISLWDELFGRK
ncbi:MAG TPA: NYN domain-containing protein [Candidatus Saccharicenans sp.]|jgi:predicted RNA-binding protein with PIN domain|nr:NYN domain-containing protein [Candidatus Saccharicenans sp.]HPB59169.1 NYN domain-containing protein [Candidatus Saccharicenans sp.]HQO75354.1 NYN domain-containing protein [Candidatus Saccharicenans sp.]HUM78629.1 NYN domain-containing protein [Candidatus Saccharicenans sp.]